MTIVLLYHGTSPVLSWHFSMPHLKLDDLISNERIKEAMNLMFATTYLVTQVNTNGTVHLKIGAVMDTMNIRCIHPYQMTSSKANHGGKCSMHHSVAQAQSMS